MRTHIWWTISVCPSTSILPTKAVATESDKRGEYACVCWVRVCVCVSVCVCARRMLESRGRSGESEREKERESERESERDRARARERERSKQGESGERKIAGQRLADRDSRPVKGERAIAGQRLAFHVHCSQDLLQYTNHCLLSSAHMHTRKREREAERETRRDWSCGVCHSKPSCFAAQSSPFVAINVTMWKKETESVQER